MGRMSLLVFGIFFFHIPRPTCQINYYSPENIYRFAQHLYQNGDYLRAAGEFQRYLFIQETSNSRDSLFFQIGLCYQLGGQESQALRYYQDIIDNFPNSQLFDKAHGQIAETFFQQNKYTESIRYIQKNIPSLSSEHARLRFNHLLGLNYLFKGRWRTAHDHFSSLPIHQPYDSTDSLTIKLKDIAIEGTQLSRRSPYLAGLMSAVVPGTGKIYAGRISDGLYSLIIVGITAWQAVDGFENNGTHSTKGWVYGSLSAFFYLGNIYGSIVAVKNTNEGMEAAFLKRIDIDVFSR
jgi:tetratricopeptide (TPR) repeat protein